MDFVRIYTSHDKPMFFLVLGKDADAVTHLDDFALPDAFLQRFSGRFNRLQVRTADLAYDHQNRNDLAKSSALYHGSFLVVATGLQTTIMLVKFTLGVGHAFASDRLETMADVCIVETT
jgi:hypothetical protein